MFLRFSKFLPGLRSCFTALVIASICTFSMPASAANNVTDENLAQYLEKLLLSKPELVLDILRRNSEIVLDIAQQGANLRRKRNLESQWRDDMKVEKKVNLEGRPVLGPANAKVKIVAFSDFTCHFCQQASKTVDAILKEYGNDVNLVFKHLPMDDKGPGGLASAYFVAVAMQNPAKAWTLYKTLFAERDRLTTEGEDFLKKTVQSLGVDMRQVANEVKGKKVAKILAEDQQDAQKLGVEGTPFFLVNNLVIRGALPLDLFREAVETSLKAKR